MEFDEQALQTVREGHLLINHYDAARPNFRAATLNITSPEVLSLQADRFDSAVSLNVFEHIEDDALALQNTRRLLQPGSTLVLIVAAHL